MATEDKTCSRQLLQQHAVSALDQMLQVINIRKEDFVLEGQYGFEGNTPLILASKANHFPSVRLLLEMGANPHSSSKRYATTPLMAAANEGNLEMVQFFTEVVGVSLDLRNALGNSACHLAGLSYRTELMEYLLNQGSSIEEKNHQGKTTLAILCNNEDYVKMLVSRGAKINLSFKNGQSIIDCTSKKEIKKFLKKKLKEENEIFNKDIALKEVNIATTSSTAVPLAIPVVASTAKYGSADNTVVPSFQEQKDTSGEISEDVSNPSKEVTEVTETQGDVGINSIAEDGLQSKPKELSASKPSDATGSKRSIDSINREESEMPPPPPQAPTRNQSLSQKENTSKRGAISIATSSNPKLPSEITSKVTSTSEKEQSTPSEEGAEPPKKRRKRRSRQEMMEDLARQYFSTSNTSTASASSSAPTNAGTAPSAATKQHPAATSTSSNSPAQESLNAQLQLKDQEIRNLKLQIQTQAESIKRLSSQRHPSNVREDDLIKELQTLTKQYQEQQIASSELLSSLYEMEIRNQEFEERVNKLEDDKADLERSVMTFKHEEFEWRNKVLRLEKDKVHWQQKYVQQNEQSDGKQRIRELTQQNKSLQEDIEILTDRYETSCKQMIQVLHITTQKLQHRQMNMRLEELFQAKRKHELCIECEYQIKDMVTIPCGHISFCEGCVNHVKKKDQRLRCPSCKVSITSFLKIL